MPGIQPSVRLTEAQFQQRVLALAKMRGWRYTHSRPAINRSGKWSTPIQGDPGFPDLVLVRNGRAIFAELKSDRGKPTPEQIAWINALTEAHLEAVIWRPQDWTHIQETLL